MAAAQGEIRTEVGAFYETALYFCQAGCCARPSNVLTTHMQGIVLAR